MTDTTAEPAAQAGRVPAHRAGAGLPAAALEAARAAGWSETRDEDANVNAASPDDEVHLGFWPETDTGPLWTLTCTAHPAWQITADDNTPAEFLAALVNAVATTGPLDPDRDRA